MQNGGEPPPLRALTARFPQAPGGVHPHVADFDGGHGPADIRGLSFYMNQPDGIWNHGEGFQPDATGTVRDTGGMLSFDDGTSVLEDHIRLTAGWQAHTPSPLAYASLPPSPTPMYRLAGYLAPRPASPPSIPIESAFELFLPQSFVGDPVTNTVIVIAGFATLYGAPFEKGGRFGYIGSPPDGLVPGPGGAFRPFPNSDFLVAWSGQAEADNLNIVAGYIVPHTGHRNLVSRMQRILQLEHAIHLILRSSRSDLMPPGHATPILTQEESLPVVVGGGSFGGLVAQLLPMYFPNRFHGAISSSFSGSLRRTMGDQESYTLLSALCGFSKNWSGTGLGLFDTLEWPAFLRQIGRDYFDASFVDRFKSPFGLIDRPQYFLMSDEDTVTNGTDWRSVLGSTRAYENAGHVNKQGPNRDVFWSIIDKACHYSRSLRIPSGMMPGGSLGTEIDDIRLAPLPFLKWVRTSFATQAPAPVPFLPPGAQDSFDHVHGRASTSIRNQNLSPNPTLLTEDTGFDPQRTRCHGTWPGRFDSTLIRQEGTDHFVYAGSADGVVTKLKLVGNELQRVQQSESLGYAAWALTVGDLGQGDKVFVGTYRAIHRLDLNLQLETSVALTEFGLWGPMHLQIADLLPPGGKHLLFHTHNGEIVAMGPSLSVQYRYSEPGIVDMLVDPTTGAAFGATRPIFIQSERGHVARLRLGPGPTEARLVGATVPLKGHPDGLCMEPGGNLAAVCFDILGSYAHTDSSTLFSGVFVRQISTDLTSAQIGGSNMAVLQSRFLGYQRGTGYGLARDFACLGNDFVIINGGRLYLLPTAAGTGPVSIELSTFPPAVFPCDMAIGELDGNTQSEEIVITTEGGRMVWLDAQLLQQGQLPAYSPASPDAYTSASLSATWGMTHDGTDLQIVDQSARRWKIDPGTGTTTYLGLLTMDASQAPMKKPFRGLGRLENPLINVPISSSDTHFTIGISSTDFVLDAAVYYPHLADLPTLVMPPTFTPPPVWDAMRHQQLFADHYVPFAYAGDTLFDSPSSKEYVYWWTGNRSYPTVVVVQGVQVFVNVLYLNLLQGGTHDIGLTTPTFFHWSSSSNGHALDLRSITDAESHNHQALRLGQWTFEDDPEDRPVVVMSTIGGSVLVVDPSPYSSDGQVKAESLDCGYGGMALAVHDVNVPGNPSQNPLIFFAPLWAHAGTAAGTTDMVSSLHILERPAATMITEVQPPKFFDGDQTTTPKLFGICGLAVGDVDEFAASGDQNDELVITTINGDLVVYDLGLVNGKVGLGSLLHWSVVDGSLGAYNSIVIANLDTQHDGNEIYIAGSNGIRKFVVNP